MHETRKTLPRVKMYLRKRAGWLIKRGTRCRIKSYIGGVKFEEESWKKKEVEEEEEIETEDVTSKVMKIYGGLRQCKRK